MSIPQEFQAKLRKALESDHTVMRGSPSGRVATPCRRRALTELALL